MEAQKSNPKQKTPVNKEKDSLIKKEKDSIGIDSIKPKEVIKGIITHDAEDYSFQDDKNKTITLYNKAHIVYTDIDLKAGIIIINYKKNMVLAKGIKDSLGYHQLPVFKQGGQESTQDSIRYNFKTKRALVYGVKTKQGEIITYAEKTKRVNDSTIYMSKLRFTTSKKKNPDYYIATDKAKLVPGKKIIVGLSNLVLADVPTPVALPFAYFPLTQKRTSGFIIPTWGDTDSQGYFLQNGGYYFAVSRYFDLTVLGDIYTNGSWGLRGDSNYVVRYKFRGNFSIRFENLIQSIKGLDDYSKSTNFNIRWSHSQDSKMSPNSRFSASVNLGSSRYYRQSLNEINIAQTMTNSLSSSISYYKKFVGTPFNMNITAQHSQNTNTRLINMTLPSLQLNMSRIFPFAGKAGRKSNPLQKMGLDYNMQGRYEINTTEEQFFKPKMFKTARTGLKHNLSTSTNIKVFKHFTLSPSVSYNDTWYFKSIRKRYDPTLVNGDKKGAVVNDTINGFKRFNNYSMSTSLSTIIYGVFNFKKGRLKSIRHTITPYISYSYTPDFAKRHNRQVQQSADPKDLLTYSPFEGGIYGTPPSGLSNYMSISVKNVLEAKVAPKDPDSDEEPKKIFILNNLNFSTGYNFAADSLRWDKLSINAGTRLFKDKLAINMSASLDPYQVNKKGQRINKFNPDIFRVDNVNLTANYSVSSKDFEKENKGEKDKSGNGAQKTPDIFGENRRPSNSFAQTGEEQDDDDENVKKTRLYQAKIPWTLSLAYSANYSNNGIESGISSNSLSFSGDLELSPKWKVGFNSGYDFKNKGFSFTRFTFSRDLDSWRLNFNWTPFGFRSSYYFFIGVKSSLLSDLKWDKNKPPDRRLF